MRTLLALFMYNTLFSILIKYNLPLEQCQGQRGKDDGISNGGAFVEERAILVHCFARCTNLCLQDKGEPLRNELNGCYEQIYLCMLVGMCIINTVKRETASCDCFL